MMRLLGKKRRQSKDVDLGPAAGLGVAGVGDAIQAYSTGMGAREDDPMVPTLYRAISSFDSAEDGDLSFKAGEVIAVTDTGSGPESWWYGEVDGREGAFPGTYVQSLKSMTKSFTAPEDFNFRDEPESTGVEVREVRPKRASSQAELERTESWESSLGVKAGGAPEKILPGEVTRVVVSCMSGTRPARQPWEKPTLRFNMQAVRETDCYTRQEYSRAGDFNPAAAQAEWEKEEDEEKTRMLLDRWAYLERSLAPGEKCVERVAHEQAEAEKARAKQVAEEEAARRRAERKLKLQQRRAKKEGRAPPAEAVACVSAPAGNGTPAPATNGAEAPEGETRAERLRRLAEARRNKGAPAPPALGAPAAAAAPAGETRAERLRRKAEERKRQKEAAEQGAVAAPSAAPPPYPEQAAAPEPDEATTAAAARAAAARSAAPLPPVPGKRASQAEPTSVEFDRLDSLKQAAETRAAPSPPRPPKKAIPQPDGTFRDNPSATSSPAAERRPTTDSSREDGAADPGKPSGGKTPVDVAIGTLQNRVKKLAQKNDQGISGLQIEFHLLDKEDRKTWQTAHCTAARSNSHLNRYNDILPYDRARVVLNESNPNSTEDYINASHITGLLPGSPEYIAAQGPTATTSEHFWKMVSQQKSRVIIMVTRLKEGKRVKCHKYWPEVDESNVYLASDSGNGVSVKHEKETNSQNWTRREFTVVEEDENGEELRKQSVTQLHFTDWPDHGVPDSASTFLNFLHAAMAEQRKAVDEAREAGEPRDPPMTVHCSAGVGRSGVFCLVYSSLTFLPHLGRDGWTEIDVLGTVRRMRQYRRYMVQTLQQYKFCYNAIVHAAKVYQDGSRHIRQKLIEERLRLASPVTTKAAQPTSLELAALEDPVWLHSDVSLKEVETLLAGGSTPPHDGKFLVRRIQALPEKLQLSVVYDNAMHHFLIQRERGDSGPFVVNRKPCGKCESISALVDFMRAPSQDWAIPLNEYVPRADASQEMLEQEDIRAARLALKAQKQAAREAPPAAAADSASNTSGSSEDLMDRRRRSVARRASDQVGQMRKRLSPPKRGSKDMVAPIKAIYTVPPEGLLTDDYKAKGEQLLLSGRVEYLTFLNGTYCEQQRELHGRPTFKLSEPIGEEFGHLQGQFVYLYYDDSAGAWVLYMSGSGVLAAAPGDYPHPAAITRVWGVLDHRGTELIEDPLVKFSALPAAEQVSLVSLDDSALSTDEEMVTLQKQLAAAQAREKVALQVVESQRLTGEQLAASQKRELMLTEQLTELQALVTGQLQSVDNADDLEQQVVESRQRVSQLNQQNIKLQGELEAALQRVAELEQQATRSSADNTEIEELRVEREGFKNKLARAMQIAKDAQSSMSRARHREDALAKMLANTKAENADLASKVSILEHALAGGSSVSTSPVAAPERVLAFSQTSSSVASPPRLSAASSQQALPIGALLQDLDDDLDDDSDEGQGAGPQGGAARGVSIDDIESEVVVSTATRHDPPTSAMRYGFQATPTPPAVDEEEEEEESDDDMMPPPPPPSNPRNLEAARAAAFASMSSFAADMGLAQPAAAAPKKRGLPTGLMFGADLDDDEGEDSMNGSMYVALRSYHAQGADELDLEEGEDVEVTAESGDDWYLATVRGRSGKIPAAYVGTKM